MHDAIVAPARQAPHPEAPHIQITPPPPTQEFAEEGLPHLVKHCNAYKGADTRKAVFQLVTTLALFAAATGAMIWLLSYDMIIPSLLLAIPTGGFLVQLFIIQHDCGHMSFFKKRKTNNIVGAMLSVLTMTPYGYWRDAHNFHHAGSGNLAKRGIGSIDTVTITEFETMPKHMQLLYRFYRHPAVVLLIGPPLHIIAMQRIPFSNAMLFLEEYRAMPTEKMWRSVTILNIALLAFYGTAIAVLGLSTALLALLPPVFIAAWAGGWLFFIQHQFEEAYWQRDEKWNFQRASVEGSSYYVLPRFLQWFTGNIGLHHIHHLCSLIPNYRLQECLDASPELQQMNRLTLRESLKCANLALWDETSKKMIRFKDLKHYKNTVKTAA